ncbi:ATP-binding protein [Jeotgalibacillus campisalis]|uniref:histidine kinase n=1 Tax=Jeotgalibacillus campisalis TaxID=220754 RepID=A0A0C2VQ56_9BACL|nr:ATP-binding protein [Jeotgalibacillus campisalis]KIL51027.1 sporulation kinase B [Jeotgalibacillus campisalis]
MTETLLNNFLFILLPVLIYLIFFEDRLSHFRDHRVFLLLASFPLVLTMTFPIKMELGFNFDLRYIPFIIAALFSGYKVAVPLYLILNVYRFILGGEGMIQSFLFSTVVLLVVPYWCKKFIQLSPRNRIIWGGIASFLVVGFYLVTLTAFFPVLNEEYWMIAVNIVPIHVIGVVVVLILIEKIIANNQEREQYLQSERLNVINELSASVSHEIRNPLTVTSGFLQLLKESKTVQAGDKEYINYSLNELKRAEKIISDFLSFAKPQAKNMITTNLENEIEYVNNIMVPYAHQHLVEIEFTFENDLTRKFDQNQIQQCLINLYKNAIEAMKEKGGILSIDVFSRKPYIIICIKDTGEGMTEEEASLIGKPYYSTKKEGTGLGMVMVYSVVDKIGGRIEIDSEKGVGTTFQLKIPVK